MANTQITLSVFRDKYAPFDPTQGRKGYYISGTSSPSPKGRSFNSNGIRGVANVTENGNTYGTFIYQHTDSSLPETVLVTQASGAIITLCNS
jgi:hypothetical protein